MYMPVYKRINKYIDSISFGYINIYTYIYINRDTHTSCVGFGPFGTGCAGQHLGRTEITC